VPSFQKQPNLNPKGEFMKSLISIIALLTTFNIFAATTAVDINAKDIKIADMKLSKVTLSKVPYETYCIEDKRRVRCTEYEYTYKSVVNVKLSYRIKGEFCRPKQGDEICFIRMLTKYTSVQFDTNEFSSDVISTLKARKFYSRKKKYVALAKSILNIEIENQHNAKVITVELK